MFHCEFRNLSFVIIAFQCAVNFCQDKILFVASFICTSQYFFLKRNLCRLKQYANLIKLQLLRRNLNIFLVNVVKTWKLVSYTGVTSKCLIFYGCLGKSKVFGTKSESFINLVQIKKFSLLNFSNWYRLKRIQVGKVKNYNI